MISWLFFSLLGGFGIVYLLIGRREAKRVQGNDAYFLGGRSLGIFSLALTLYATQFGGGTLMGAAEEAYAKGWIVLLYPLGVSLGFLALAVGFGAKLRSWGLTTVAELFEKVYGSKKLRKLVSLISMGTMFFILVGQGVAARKLFGALGVDTPYLFLGFWTLLILYTVAGGLKAVVYTDAIKALFILGVLVVVALFATGGLAGASLAPRPLEAASAPLPWVGWLLMPLLFMLFEQDTAQRCFAAKSARAVTVSGVLAAVLLFLSSGFGIAFGIVAGRLGLPMTASKGILIEVVEHLTSPVVSTFFAVAIVMVILSTADSLLCSVASNLVFDFPVSNGIQEKKRVFLSQALTFLIGVAAMSCSLFFDRILPLLIQSYEFSVCTLVVPVVMALFLKRPRLAAALAAMSAGALGFFLFRLWESPIPGEIAAMALSLAAFTCVHAFLARRKAAWARGA